VEYKTDWAGCEALRVVAAVGEVDQRQSFSTARAVKVNQLFGAAAAAGCGDRRTRIHTQQDIQGPAYSQPGLVLLVAQVSDREGGQLSHPRYLVFSLGVTVKTRLLFLFLPLHEVYVLLISSIF